ncbi:MAG: 3'(2'),5'-bisphosphate nucleotidase CysQ [Acidimicrobiia bacterium]
MSDVLTRIDDALDAALDALHPFDQGRVQEERKAGGDPVTAADIAVDSTLSKLLPRPGEGWLSEETADDGARLGASEVWIIDPLDGTREFVDGIPEWCVSIGYVVDGVPVAGGVAAPSRGLRIVGAVGEGVRLDGAQPVAPSPTVAGALVLASRSEVKRGEWESVFATPVAVRNMGSVALKLAMVGAGMADATWTLVPKNEWDVAGGAAIVHAAGGVTVDPSGEPVLFNRANTLMPGFVATRADLIDEVMELIHGLA